MKRSTYTALAVGLMFAASARGQGSSSTGAWGFVNTRYDTRSSVSMYAGYGWHSLFAMGGVLRNPRTGQAEILGGVGGAFKTWPRVDHWVAFATARMGDDSYGQVFWLPTMRTDFGTLRVNAKWTIPYKGSAAQKLTISPLSMTRPLTRRLAGGVAVDLVAAEHTRTSGGVGPELRLRLPGAVLVADALHDVTAHGSRHRVFFASVF